MAPPEQFHVRLQHGITGGFAPPTPKAVHMLTRSGDSPADLKVQSLHKDDGAPELSELAPKKLKVDDHAALIEELETLLKGLPTEKPPGSEDIYGLDTSIAYGSPSLEWANGGPAGCGGGTSTVQADADDKKKFARAVEIVNHLASAS